MADCGLCPKKATYETMYADPRTKKVSILKLCNACIKKIAEENNAVIMH